MRALAILKSCWTVACVLVLAVTLYAGSQKEGSDIGIFLIGCMTVLAFPASILVSGVMALVIWLEEGTGVRVLDVVTSNDIGFALLWLAYFVAGYLQWFLLLPWLWRKWKSQEDAQ